MSDSTPGVNVDLAQASNAGHGFVPRIDVHARRLVVHVAPAEAVTRAAALRQPATGSVSAGSALSGRVQVRIWRSAPD